MRVRIHDGPSGSPSYDAVSWPGRGALVARRDGSVFRWTPGGGFEPLKVPTVGKELVAFTARGTSVLVCSSDTLHLLVRDHPVASIDLGAREWGISRVALARDASDIPVIVWGDERGALHVVQGRSGTRTATHPTHTKSVSSLHLVDDGALGLLAVSAADDRHVIVTTVESGERILDVTKCAGWVIDVVPVVRNGLLKAVVVADRVGVTGWDVATARPIFRVRGVAPAGLSFAGAAVTWAAEGVAWEYLHGIGPHSRPGLVSEPVAPPLIAGTEHLETNGKVVRGRIRGNEITQFELPAPVLRWLPNLAARSAIGLLATGEMVEVEV